MADEHRYDDPATTRLPHPAYDDPRHNPIAFLPTGVEGRLEYEGAVDYARPVPAEREAMTAGEQDHSDPWRYAGEDADPPSDTGRLADG